MLPYPNINPEIVKVGPLSIRWYGLMYLIGFICSYLIVKREIKRKGIRVEKDFLENLYFYLILGLLIGARLGYVIFYNLSYYIENPLHIFALWQGGMSFHGGLIGVVISAWLFTRAKKFDFFTLTDMLVLTAPIGIGLGRIGNFINGELYGRVTNVPWAMIFPEGGPLPRHPSQLYEAALEGVVLFTILWFFKDKFSRSGILSSLFLVLYGIFRFFVEFFREPDPQIGYILGIFTMGQILCLIMIFSGALLLSYRIRQ
ncbi:MAG: prolipoprotein diacylglyceryl transferase [Thermodesulfovibrio sp.]|uniref:prolipoprotein diacylglyceryl transferase n=1 Tax=Thermodesulfovibrio sp. N1 TaxID=1871110 RepID=UPI00083A1F79|nr:prolipoprotein diacylglyceryl transferase [Thermodesulfovibrio sp. N1]MDI6713761.1 prolipoprotein diacylglyceryl transferase [Thermodesulfovibrio sp.]ODA45169.1 Prolipoprotein diacylglyceryl transferase [Thermodesulfovibrio sp. N1]